jgi:hypothetical protein
MKPRFSIQLKAAFLLVVFSINTVVGFACAVGLDMGFNTKHHEDEQATGAVVHIHADGKKHIHQEIPDQSKSHHSNKETTKAVVHVHANGKKHIHKEKNSNESQDKSNHEDEASNVPKSSEGKDNCCNDKVMQFAQLDKSVAPTFTFISPVFYTASLSTYYYKDVLYSFEGPPTIKYFVRSYHPPIPDIRIAIKSFQI